MTCRCDDCGSQYHVDVIVPDDLWDGIKPEGKPKGGGLLCGLCIMELIEARDEHAAFRLERQP